MAVVHQITDLCEYAEEVKLSSFLAWFVHLKVQKYDFEGYQN